VEEGSFPGCKTASDTIIQGSEHREEGRGAEKQAYSRVRGRIEREVGKIKSAKVRVCR
jgi:hypothetical protein